MGSIRETYIYHSLSMSRKNMVPQYLYLSVNLLLFPMNFQIIFLGKLETTKEESKVVRAGNVMGNDGTDMVV